MSESTHIATTGGAYYPEMGERQDGTALFVRSIGRAGYYITWPDARHSDALSAFARLRIRPRHMESYARISDGARQWSASVTWDAGNKLAPMSVTKMLLD
jgi:hypothetical protein